MASGVAAIPRSASAAGRMHNLPVIQHPMSRLGDRSDLTIRGSSSMSLRRERTVVTVHGGKVELGLNRGNFYPGPHPQEKKEPQSPTPVRQSAPERMLQWPPACDFAPPYKYKTDPAKGLLSGKVGIHRPPDVGVRHSLGSVRLPPLTAIDESEEYTQKPGTARQRSRESTFRSKSSEELFEVIKDKLTTGYFGLRHLFKGNDPAGQGNVSREALLRILYTLCGYISTDQYNKLLKRMNLEGKQAVSFETFVSCFKDNETVKKEWVTPIQNLALEEAMKRRNLEEHLKRTDMLVHDPYTTFPFSDAIFKEKVKSRDFDARKIFPAACFDNNGLIVPPQLREAFAQLGIYMRDDDFDKLWQRYDKEGTGAIRTTFFFKKIGLDNAGHSRSTVGKSSVQRPHSEIPHSVHKNKDDKKLEVQDRTNTAPVETTKAVHETVTCTDKAIKDDTAETNELKSKEDTTKMEEETCEKKVKNDKAVEADSKMKSLKHRRSRKHPKLENVVDCLHYKFEEPFNAMMMAFQLFDFLNDGYISRVDFRRVLQEFGFNITVTEMDHFLSRSGIRSIRGQISYKEFLTKYQTRSENSLTNKIVMNQNHSFQGESLPPPPGSLSSDELEARLVEHFHGDFFKLIGYFKSCDKYNLGVITQHEFRSGIERRLGYTMSDKQWDQLKADVGQDSDGLIPFPKFLLFFDIMPGSWNQKPEGTAVVSQVAQADMAQPPAIDKLREKARTAMQPQELEKTKSDGPRTLAEVQRALEELFRTRFHTFDKHFKEMDRKMTGRMSKWQFGALIKLCGLVLTTAELERLWATLNVANDGMYSYSTLIKHFVQFKAPPEKPEDVVLEDTTELVETARRIQKERKEAKEKGKETEKAAQEVEHAKVELKKVEKEKPEITEKPLDKVQKTVTSPSVPKVEPKTKKTRELLVKCQADVINNWEGLKSVFKFIDRNGFATCTSAEMKDVMDSMHFHLSEEEKKEVIQRFDLQRNGRFHYLEFMRCYAKGSDKDAAKSKHLAYSSKSHKLEQKFLKEWKNLRRAFKKLDRNNDGYLEIADFRRSLRSCNIRTTDEDFYHLMSEFDLNMDGRISYEEFLATILSL